MSREWVMSHMNEAHHIWMSREWVMSHMNEARHVWMVNESCHIWMRHITYEWWMSHVTYEWGTSHMNKSCMKLGSQYCRSHNFAPHLVSYTINECDLNVSYMNKVVHKWVMSHTWSSHVTCINESRLLYERVMSHIWKSHVRNIHELRHIYEWGTSHMNESCDICEQVTSHKVTSHVTCINEYERVRSHLWTSHITHMHESCLTYSEFGW